MSSNGGVISERGIWKELEVVIAQFYGTICLEGQRKTMKTSVRIDGLWADT
jgi:hypothetical protein